MTSFGPLGHSTAEAASRMKRSAAPLLSRTPSHPLLNLQRNVGNGVVSRLIAQREGPDEEMLEAKHDPALAQREAEGGEMEEEELAAKHDPALAQREAEGGEMEEEELAAKHDTAMRAEEDELMTSADTATPQVGLEGGPVGADLESRINSQRGGGSMLEPAFRTNMESNLGTSLDSVRVHTGAESDALNRSISAKAFTTGSDIFLRNDVSASDHSTMAHEVAHVAQQQTMDPGASSGGGMSVGAADSAYEHEADSFAAEALSSPAPDREADEA